MAILNDLDNGVDTSTNDTIAGTPEDDTVNLHGGNDYFYDIYDSNDYIFDTKKSSIGSSGDDAIWAGGGDDVIVSIFDSTTVSPFGYAEGFHGGAGNDTLNFVPSEAGVTVDLAQNTATNAYGARALVTGFETVHGSGYKDFLLGDVNANEFYGWSGDDVIDGRGGDDFLNGGTGNDWINGGDGNDSIYGGDLDPFYPENDTIYGGKGADLIFAGLGDDRVYGEAGADRMFGGIGNDTMYGGADADELSDGRGNDALSGGSGDDTITGGEGNDRLSGDSGNDRIFDGDGNDLVYGGLGADLIASGLGRDTFVFKSLRDSGTSSLSADKISNFTTGLDHIDVSMIDANALVAGNQAFRFIGDHAFTKAGQISATYSASTNETIVRFNTDGDAATEMLIRLSGNIKLGAGDFIL